MESFLVGSEVAVVYSHSTEDPAVVVVTLGEVAGLMMIFPVGEGEGEDLLTMEQINKMNIDIIALVMVGLILHLSNEEHIATVVIVHN